MALTEAEFGAKWRDMARKEGHRPRLPGQSLGVTAEEATRKEQIVAELRAKGLTRAQIAYESGFPEGTVKSVLKRLNQ